MARLSLGGPPLPVKFGWVVDFGVGRGERQSRPGKDRPSEDPTQACPPLAATPQTSFLPVAPAGCLARFVLLHRETAAVHPSAVLKIHYDDDFQIFATLSYVN